MSALWPEISALLFDASSQAKTLGGKNGTVFLNHSSTVRVASLLAVISPLASTSSGAVAVEHRADPLHRIARGADRHAERIAGLVAFLGRLR